jgi:hypothetical protein
LPRLFFLYGRIVFRGRTKKRCTKNSGNLTSASAIGGQLRHGLADIAAAQGGVEVDYAPTSATTEAMEEILF